MNILLGGQGKSVTLTIKPIDNSDNSDTLFHRVRNALIEGDLHGRFDKGTVLTVSLPPEMFANSNRQIKVAIEDARISLGIPLEKVVYEHQRSDPTITPEIPTQLLSAQQ